MSNIFDSLFQFFQSPENVFYAFFEVFLIYIGLYYFIRFCEGTRGAGILKGLALIVTVSYLCLTFGTRKLNLNRLDGALQWLVNAGTIAIIILLQPELRRGLARLSQSQLFRDIVSEEAELIDELLKSVYRLAKNRVGALIALEREDSLQPYIERGTPIDADVRSELLSTIFYPGTDLHDGAVILQRGRLAAAGSLFPLSEDSQLGTWAGTRHRAAVGLTEETDAVVVVVSEERGEVSLCVRGKIYRNLDRDELEAELRKHVGQEEEVLASAT